MNLRTTNHAERFIRELLADACLRERVETTLNSQEALRDLVNTEGFHFTREEWEVAVRNLLRPSGSELSDTALDEIIGAGDPADVSESAYRSLLHACDRLF